MNRDRIESTENNSGRIQQNNSKEIYENIYKKYLLPCLADIENDQMEACRENYVSMVHELERKYLYS